MICDFLFSRFKNYLKICHACAVVQAAKTTSVHVAISDPILKVEQLQHLFLPSDNMFYTMERVMLDGCDNDIVNHTNLT